MAPPLAPQLAAPPPPPTRNAQQVGAILRTQAVRAPRPAIVRHATLDLELAALNADLGALGLTYRVPDAAAMRAVKRAAGQANTTTPASDYAQLETAVVRALYLGALGGADVRPPEQQRFADEFRAAIIDEVPDRARQLRAKAFTFDDCEQYAARVTEEPITGMLPKSLARKVAVSLGHGNLQGIFPGEQLEATHEQAGPGRLDRMNELGREIVRLLAAEVGDVKPELTGSIVLVGGGYTGVPEDLDINVTTRGTVQQRAEQWLRVQEVMNELDGLTLAREDGSPIRVFAMSKGRLQGENPNIWERRFGYGHKPAADRPSLVVPIEVEVKDVGGPVWMEHLNDKAATSRAPAEDGASQPRWLMLDTMTRILGHKKNMTESVAQPNADMVANVPPGERVATWTGMVQREGVEKSVEKRLWEKMTVAAKMAVTDKFSRADLLAWLRQCVKPGRAAEYVALLDLTRSERAYEAWLQRLD